jgi:phosphoenolpyruvate synthase/pyruvate phosphate dikinase
MSSEETGIVWFKDCSYNNKHLVGGKCSSLGELHYLAKMINFEIADGYAVTTTLYDRFIEENNLTNIINHLYLVFLISHHYRLIFLRGDKY